MGIKIDYVRMRDLLLRGRKLLRAYFYAPQTQMAEGFFTFLRSNGFRVISKELREYTDAATGSITKKCNLDIEIAIDMLLLAPHYDTAVLVSGDGDFVRLVDALSYQGKRVEICALRRNTSGDLINICDGYIDLEAVREEIELDESSRRVDRDMNGNGSM
jgi:uncharacterized LabA/DUF88 family protein